MKLKEPPWQLSDPYEQVAAAFASFVRRIQAIPGAVTGEDARIDDVSVSIVRSEEERAAADQLISERYAWRGYLDQSKAEASTCGTCVSHTSVGLLAFRRARPVGTLTLGLDGENGLVADEANPELVDALRVVGKRVVELRRFAVQDDGESKTIFANLFFAAYRIGRLLHRATDVLIEVNPRHEAYYRRIFGFARAGREWICPRVNAPAVLMHLDVTNLEERLGALHQWA